MSTSHSITILFATETGHAESIARKMTSMAKEKGFDPLLRNMADFDLSDFQDVQYLAAIVSTHGIGEPPIASERLFYKLESAQDFSLETVRYSVLALGDTEYALFCEAGRDFDKLLERHGAKKLFPRAECDVDFEETALKWISSFLLACGAG